LNRNNGVAEITHRHWNGKTWRNLAHRFANQVPYRNGSDDLQVNWLKLVITNEVYRVKSCIKTVSCQSHDHDYEVIHLAQIGRTRLENWKRKYNTLKNQGLSSRTQLRTLVSKILANSLLLLIYWLFLSHTLQEWLNQLINAYDNLGGSERPSQWLTRFNSLHGLWSVGWSIVFHGRWLGYCPSTSIISFKFGYCSEIPSGVFILPRWRRTPPSSRIKEKRNQNWRSWRFIHDASPILERRVRK